MAKTLVDFSSLSNLDLVIFPRLKTAVSLKISQKMGYPKNGLKINDFVKVGTKNTRVRFSFLRDQ